MFKKIEKEFETIVKRLQKHYSFLEGVPIDVAEGYGLKRVTAYDPNQNSIYLDLKALKKVYNTPRFVRRLGRVKSFREFVLLVLLHEIAHVQQFQTIPDHRLSAAAGELNYETDQGHDECWLEKEADEWARREFRKWKKRQKASSVN